MAALAITAANVLKSSGGVQTAGVAAVAIAQGQAVYQLSDGTYGLADANGVPPANTVAGIALCSAAAGQPFFFIAADPNFKTGATHTLGLGVYLSPTAGGITETVADIVSGCTAIFLGVPIDTTHINLSPVVGGVV